MPNIAIKLGLISTAIVLLWKTLGAFVYRYARRTTTILDDLPQLGLRRPGNKLSGTAVIAGGSLAGILTARVLSQHFEKVIIIEPDTELEYKRTRVGQWNQLHAFLPLIRLVLLRFFPDFDDKARKAGCSIGPCTVSGSTTYEGHYLLVDAQAVPPTVVASRMSFERLVRSLVVSRCPNVSITVGTVTGILATPDNSRIGSVQYRNSEASRHHSIETAFFADCSGPACGAIQWLSRADQAWTARKETYDPRVCYSSRGIQLRPEQLKQFDQRLPEQLRDSATIGANIGSTKSGSHLAFGLAHADNNTVIIMAAQWGHGEALPQSFDEYVDFAKLCEDRSNENGRSELFSAFDVLREALGDEAAQAHTMIKYSIAGMHHVRYDQLASLPSNFVAVGDSIMRLNPTFGQGVAKIGQDVTTLDAVLRRCTGSVVPDSFSKQLLAMQTSRNRPWFDSTRIMDYRFSTTVPMDGETLDTGRLQRLWSVAMIKLCHKDADAGTSFTYAVNNLEPAVMLLKPSFVARVLWNALRS